MAYDPLQVALVYAHQFAARTDVYSTWVVGPDPAKPIGWRPVREWLTPEVTLAGLTGSGPSISGFMIAPGSTSHIAAIDFDTDNGLEQAIQLERFMDGQGLSAYVETSRRGAHIWIPIDRACPAVAIRHALRGLLQEAGLPTDDPHLELRPGSDHVNAEWHEHVTDAVVGTGLGHALRMPLMPHPKTGKRSRFLSDPLSLAQFLLDLREVPAEQFLSWGEKWVRPPVIVPPSHRNPREPFPEDDASASELLRTLWSVHDAVPGKVVSCPAKEFHSHNDIHKGLKVFLDDRRIICHAAGCVLNNEGRGRGTYELRKLAPHAG